MCKWCGVIHFVVVTLLHLGPKALRGCREVRIPKERVVAAY